MDINDKMRAILVDWLVEVHLKFKVLLCACFKPLLIHFVLLHHLVSECTLIHALVPAAHARDTVPFHECH